MASDLSIMKMASAMAQHAALRHKLISQNMANADTPGFKALDVAAFDPKRTLKAQTPKPGVAGVAGATKSAIETAYQPEQATGVEADPTGNTVSIEREMLRAADAQAQHQAALTIYRKSMDILRLSVTGRIR